MKEIYNKNNQALMKEIKEDSPNLKEICVHGLE
jgi:hypothetical protein